MERPRDALADGTELAGYILGRVLGRGGFAITYFATDALHPQVTVAIKEFLPAGLAVREPDSVSVHPASGADVEEFAKSLKRFQDEARTLVALRHPNIVDAQRFIKANGTAYVVMKYEEGVSLGDHLGVDKVLPAATLRKILPPLLDGLETVHAGNFLHRDIKPHNIYLRSADGSPVLLDFGAARQAMADERGTSLTEIVTPGYAPYEQYDRHSAQGPYTDIYALGATLYRCVTGQRPPDATRRVNALARKQPDPMPPARAGAKGTYAPALLDAIDKSLAVFEHERPQSIAELRGMLGLDAAAESGTLNLARSAPASSPAEPETATPQPPPARRRPGRALAAGIAALLVLGGSYYAWSEYRASQERAAVAAKTEAEQRRRAEEERARAEAEAKRKTEEERQRAEAEAKRKEEARRKAEEDARRKAEEEARRKAEEEARKKAEEETRRKAAEEARKKAEEEAKKKAEEERQRAEAEAKRKTEEEARRKAEEEARRKQEVAMREEEAWQKCRTEKSEEAQHSACTAFIDLGNPTGSRRAFAYLFRANASVVLGRTKLAIEDCDKAISIDPTIPAAYLIRGWAYEVLRERAAAIRDYREAARLGSSEAKQRLVRLGVQP